MPERAAYACTYVKNWVAVKWRWHLRINTAEQTFLTRELRSCGWPWVPKPSRPAIVTGAMIPPTPAPAYGRQWALRVVSDLVAAAGSLEGRTIEIHAGASYVDPLEPLLSAAAVDVRVPLRGLNQGQHLAWYSSNPTMAAPVQIGTPGLDLRAEVDRAIVAGARR